jgi:hypothetical protein
VEEGTEEGDLLHKAGVWVRGGEDGVEDGGEVEGVERGGVRGGYYGAGLGDAG